MPATTVTLHVETETISDKGAMGWAGKRDGPWTHPLADGVVALPVVAPAADAEGEGAPASGIFAQRREMDAARPGGDHGGDAPASASRDCSLS